MSGTLAVSMRACALALLSSIACVAHARADERILSYDSTLEVQPDGTLDVHEVIRVQAEGRQIRRGIYRDFPTIYPGRNGGRVVVGFDFRSARRDGHAEQWRTEKRGNGVRIYLGNANVMLPPGEHTYEIDYRTDRQLGFFSDHDEVYWNVTGNGWDFAIDSASARVILPAGVPRSEIRTEAYTGPQGARGTAWSASIDNDAPTFTTTQSLGRHEGLTIVVMFPKGFVTPPVQNAPDPGSTRGAAFTRFQPAHGVGERGNSVLRDVRPVFFGTAGVAVLFLYYLWIWNRVGRDPPGRIAIPEYEPPAGVSPGAMRYLMQMRYDDRCFAADVLDLAVKGHLVIEEHKSGFIGLKKHYTLVKRASPGAEPLSAEARALLAQIFEDGEQLELEQKNHARVAGAKAFHQRMLKGRFTPGFFRINGGWHAIGVLWSLAVAFSLFVSANRYVLPEWYFTTPLGWITLGAVLIGLAANGVFGKLLKAPTVAGRAVMDHVRGFKMYLEVAEGEELKRVAAPPPPLTPELYQACLPAALGLGVEQRWGERFAEVFADPAQRNTAPGWYSGSSWDTRHVGSFSSSLGSQLSGAISSAATAPGSSSGGGGGGSSGGGGGGGGGGGW